MSSQAYSIFKRKGSKGWHVFDGHVDTVAQARMYGQLRYTLGSEPTKITLSTAIADFDDDERTLFDTTTIPLSLTGQELLVANSDAFVTSFAIIHGPNTRIEANERAKGMGWKFTDASDTKYKWAVDMRTMKWELQNSRGIVATFSAGLFDTQGLGIYQ
ncbi:hypothetical protein DL89DRAFT_295492 [Linderina pennispora]|uniref:Uncharacterized protein n=1 Tax=Linderina pennispora TaxID=61395 RepID=A0A1Y1VZG8_9FUNG|nr:uncharacterized protein DL89DRAFT_295492 [Linderina pennispora]ORX66650.1 hypothetical protein DL89DRAFT_295492 [Linderina pennispora]